MSDLQGEIPRYALFDQEVHIDKLKELFEIHGDVLIGIKVFIGHNDSPGAELTHKVMKKAREVCDTIGCRMFVHVANPDVPLPELIDYFKPGDNFTHAYNLGNILDKDGNVYPEAWAAKKRGVLFDSARGSRNWNAQVAKAAFAQGFTPDVITDDLTALSNDPQTSRLTVHMAECMAFGMSFDDVLYKATNVPASYMNGVQVGLKRGYPGNITILELEEGPHTFIDAFGENYVGDTFIKPRATIINGKIMFNTIETDY
jgi:dihydroorotase